MKQAVQPGDKWQVAGDKRNRAARRPCHLPLGTCHGFTLIELLVAMAIIAVLATLLLSALVAAKAQAKEAICLNNLKELILAAQLYAADNDSKLAENHQFTSNQATNSWVLGNVKKSSDATNIVLLGQSKLFPYALNENLFHCPADDSQSAGTPRVRSYSMNSWMGSRDMEAAPFFLTGYRTFVKDSELTIAAASTLWYIADEDVTTMDDGWFLVTMNDSQPFASFPALRHRRGYGLNFVDGHAEIYRLRDPETALGTTIKANNADWIKLKQVTTFK